MSQGASRPTGANFSRRYPPTDREWTKATSTAERRGWSSDWRHTGGARRVAGLTVARERRCLVKLAGVSASEAVVDPDAVDTWPTWVRQLVEEWDDTVPESEFWENLHVPDGGTDELVAALAGHRLRAYHCTRLLAHEAQAIRQQGIRVFARDLFDERITAAASHGAITDADRDALLRGHMYGCGEAHSRGQRAGQVCLVTGRSVFDHDPDAVRPLLSSWGGEGIYFSSGTARLEPLLRTLGTPTVVVTALPMLTDHRSMRWFPPLSHRLLATWRRVPGHADLHYSAPVPPDAVVDLWKPGHPEYDRHRELPFT